MMNQKKRPFRELAEALRQIREKRPSDAEIEKINKIIEESNSENIDENNDGYSGQKSAI